MLQRKISFSMKRDCPPPFELRNVTRGESLKQRLPSQESLVVKAEPAKKKTLFQQS